MPRLAKQSNISIALFNQKKKKEFFSGIKIFISFFLQDCTNERCTLSLLFHSHVRRVTHVFLWTNSERSQLLWKQRRFPPSPNPTIPFTCTTKRSFMPKRLRNKQGGKTFLFAFVPALFEYLIVSRSFTLFEK